MSKLEEIGQRAKEASKVLGLLDTGEKNRLLLLAAEKLKNHQDVILTENKRDLETARGLGMKAALLDRLALSESRIQSMAEGLEAVARLDDPVGEVLDMKTLPNGLTVGKKRVPLGVVGMIYESRPNVTSDVFGLCLKSGNAAILRGGSDAIGSNRAIAGILREALEAGGYNPDFLQLIEDTSRETALEFMRLRKYVDVLIPRGGGRLIQTVVENANIPVIETGVGNCHIFMDASGDMGKSLDILLNAKLQRPGTCNACEKLLVHRDVAEGFLPGAFAALSAAGVTVKGDEEAKGVCPEIISADEEDWYQEYLDYIIAVKVVGGVEEAIAHINQYSSHHSEAILTENYSNAQKFLNEVDSAAVYVNASTRFTDGFELGLGAEIGISTQKLHARGPMGLRELTTTKFIIYGNWTKRK